MIEDPEKLNELITECSIRRLTTEESLDYIKQNGIKLSERTFRRYKKELIDSINERVLSVDDNVIYNQVLQGLDSIKKVDKELWNLFYSTKDEMLKGKLLESIEKLQDRLIEYYHKVSWKGFHIMTKIRKNENEETRLETYKKWVMEERKRVANKSKLESKQDVLCN